MGRRIAKKQLGLALLPALAVNAFAQQRPNILLIVADDLGKGDISAYGSTTISTPNMDALAHTGVCFNNAYATSATSTPSRFAMFTGMYPWKNPNAKILAGNAPLIISADQPTLPKTLQAAGYSTAAIGKWHLGMGNGNVNWNEHISPDANSVGFDYTCVIAATNDRVPTVFVRNGMVVGLDPEDPIEVSYIENFPGEPTAITNPEMMTKMKWFNGHQGTIVNGIPRIGFMKGGHAARWVDEDEADFFSNEVKTYLDTVSKEKPFFLYYGLHEPHVPRVPNQRFVGATTLGPRGDAVVEADWCVGEVMNYLEEHSLLENTIVIFTSDNGPVVNDGYADNSWEMLGSHDPMNGMRGGKYSLFDAGTHVPMFVYWKGHTKASTSNAVFSQMDFFASIASIAGAPMPDGTDSRNLSRVLLGKRLRCGRKAMVLEAEGRLCYRRGHYVLIPPYEGNKLDQTGIEVGIFDHYALFDLRNDPSQQEDISAAKPRRVKRMSKQFKKYLSSQNADNLSIKIVRE